MHGVARAGFAPLRVPDTITFEEPTPAWNVESGEKLGDFQPGLTVTVVEQRGEHYLVEFERALAPNIPALIEMPDLSQRDPAAFEPIARDLGRFALLERMLRQDEPWPESAETLAQAIFTEVRARREVRAMELEQLEGGYIVYVDPTEAGETDDSVVWVRLFHEGARLLEVSQDRTQLRPVNLTTDATVFGLEALDAWVDYSLPSHPRVILELWNKADSPQLRHRIGEKYTLLRESLERMQRYFYPAGFMEREARGTGITALSQNVERFFLCNDVVADLRFEPGEYLILELSSYAALRAREATDMDVDALAERLPATVKEHPEGFIYLDTVPMINQGEKGYCAAATLARTLQHYGFAVDMHALAKLAETEYYGTSGENLIDSMRRICNSTPFRLKEVRRQKGLFREVETILRQGQPLIWGVPGHLRLVIGIHPESKEIVYTDTWGRGHEYKALPWSEFTRYTVGLWVLDYSR